ncbi:chromosome segregation protein SudA [Diplogelasinospora grovesii]|uniref:Structural maintenance of chromosomes protein n=1 Tax=Diplogelasinospora grovesii TaxID=303347 RepID=A0AAN6N3N0_9PEZI|nr:chromosome segregation protein SudA [Diplogelasinospora grovesii]
MHIKQIIIQGFKSYKEQTVIEPFSPGTNVIVGRNGSGKSNFFAAIRFVLSDAYTNMSREERQALLHEGSGSAVMSAYVEIIFDNTDKRFSEPGDEVVIRRTIGLKKDEYSVDKKVQTRTDVLKILETAGFAKENPFYIVPQGRVAAITNMKETERLNLLKEIAGTNTYDDRRIQSLKIMGETTSKREKIDELLNYIKERLSELEEEKDELRDFQEKDRERRCLEYAHWHRLQEANSAAIEQLEETRQSGAGASVRDQELQQKAKSEVDSMEKQIHDLRQEMDLLAIDRGQLDEDRRDAARTLAKAELKVKHSDESRHAREQQQQQNEAQLEKLRQQIQAAESELAKMTPEYEKWRAEEGKVKTQRDLAATERNRLLTKQSRSTTYTSKSQRDTFLKKQINEINLNLGKLKANEMEAKEQVELVQGHIEQLEKEIQGIRERIEGYGVNRDSLGEKLKEAQEARDQLEDERKRLRREEDRLRTRIGSTRRDLHQAESDLKHSMDKATADGLASIRRLKREKNIPGAYGTLAELMTVPMEAYRLPVEQVAGNSLFHYVVDNERTGTMLSEHLYNTCGGRLTFMPLEQLRPRQTKMPRASDAQPLISKIEYDPAYDKAFQQVFGRTIVCPSLAIASQYARTHGLDAITPEGDTTNKRGAMTGGFVDSRKSRLEAVRRVNELRDAYDSQEADADKIRREIEIIDQKITSAAGEQNKLEQQMRVLESSNPRLDLQSKTTQLQRQKTYLSDAQNHLDNAAKAMKDNDDNLTACQAELASEFRKALSAEEERQLEESSSQERQLQQRLNEVSKKRLELEGRKRLLETQLEADLRPQETQLLSQAFDSTAEGGGSGSYRDAQKDLQKAQKAVAEIERRLKEHEKQMGEVSSQLADLEARMAQRVQEMQEIQKRMDQYHKKMDKYTATKARLQAQSNEYSKNIRDLGILPEEAFGKYQRMKPEQIESKLRKVNEALKKYRHVNKKAFDQYNSFTKQRDELLSRRKELDVSQESIEALIEHLDQAKDEAIQRTFKQVSKEFSTIFEKLVPAGHGRLVIQRKAERAPKGKGRKKDANPDPEDSEDDGPATGVENYTGVGISVSFNSKVMDEQQKIQQLSGGQKSLCALCLIFALQAAESSPFVIFDEVDANLDAQYRTAVASLLVSISKTQHTQFICTTFRPEIVMVADKCYGVTFHNKTSTIDCVPTNDALNFVEGQQNTGKK